LVAGHAKENTAALPSPLINDSPEWETKWMQRYRGFVDIVRKGGIDVLFIGDSMTNFWRNRGKAVWHQCRAPSNVANFGINGDRTHQVLWTAP
jgi:hypothetical protein